MANIIGDLILVLSEKTTNKNECTSGDAGVEDKIHGRIKLRRFLLGQDVVGDPLQLAVELLEEILKEERQELT